MKRWPSSDSERGRWRHSRSRAQEWTFFEIDPLIVRVAEDPNYFSYLTECIDGYDLVLGDGRLAKWPRNPTVSST